MLKSIPRASQPKMLSGIGDWVVLLNCPRVPRFHIPRGLPARWLRARAMFHSCETCRSGCKRGRSGYTSWHLCERRVHPFSRFAMIHQPVVTSRLQLGGALCVLGAEFKGVKSLDPTLFGWTYQCVCLGGVVIVWTLFKLLIGWKTHDLSSVVESNNIRGVCNSRHEGVNIRAPILLLSSCYH